MNDTERLPLFPLGLVMLPEMRLPLHIFEERYKLLINTCIEQKKRFGIVYYNGTTLLKHGATVEVDQIIRSYDDGRFDLIGTGRERFFISKLYEEKPYIEADVTYYDDESDIYDSPLGELAKEALSSVSRIAEMSGKALDTSGLLELGLKKLSFLLTAADILSVEEKQENLESVSVRCRFERILTAANRHIDRISCLKKIQKIIGDDQDISHLFN